MEDSNENIEKFKKLKGKKKRKFEDVDGEHNVQNSVPGNYVKIKNSHSPKKTETEKEETSNENIENFKKLKAKEKRKFVDEDGEYNEQNEAATTETEETNVEKTEKFKTLKSKEKRNFEDVEGEYNSQNKSESDKPDWKKVKLERKELKQKRKQQSSGGNEVYELSVSAKKIWEELRRENCKKERKIQLCTDLYGLIKGKVKSLIYAHDTVRVIENLFTAGDEDVRANLFLELKDDILDLSKNKYSRFFVVKILRNGTKEQKAAVIKSMMTNVVKLMNHKIACDVLEVAYNDCANAQQRMHIVQEFYGPRFRLFKEDLPTLEAAIKKYPEQKEKILADVNSALQLILTKGVFTNVLVHTLLKEYLYACSEADKKNIIESLKEGLLPILHTRDGARVAMQCLWNGTTKDKKCIIKSFKGNITKMALEKQGHMVLLAAFDCMDDTVLISKIIIPELMANLEALLDSESGKRVLRYLVAPRDRIFFHHDIVSVLQEGDGLPYSKKDRDVKYKELQVYVAKPILNLIHGNINTWARDSHWTLFIGSALQTLYDDTLTISIFASLAEICAEAYLPGDGNHFLEVGFMSKMITYVIQGDKGRSQQNRPIFSSYLVDAAETEMKGWCLTNRGCFIIVNLIETEISDVVKRVLQICSSVKSKLKKLSFPGAEVLLRKLK